MSRYSVLIDGEAGAYDVVVCDIPGCVAMGKTVDEAIDNAAEALRVWVDDAKENGERVPTPRSVEVLHKDPDVLAALDEGATLARVPLVQDNGRPI